MIIARELGLEDRYGGRDQKYPLAKVESLFHLRHEDGSVQFSVGLTTGGICPRLRGETG